MTRRVLFSLLAAPLAAVAAVKAKLFRAPKWPEYLTDPDHWFLVPPTTVGVICKPPSVIGSLEVSLDGEPPKWIDIHEFANGSLVTDDPRVKVKRDRYGYWEFTFQKRNTKVYSYAVLSSLPPPHAATHEYSSNTP